MYRKCLECNNGQGVRLPPGALTCPHDHDAVVTLLEVGDILGDFRVEEVLPAGEGGYATVYRASPLRFGYPPAVALKVASTNRWQALEREAAALLNLQDINSTHLPRLFTISSEHQAPLSSGVPGQTNSCVGRAVVDMEPFYYLVIEYLPGGSLGDHVAKRRGKGLGVEKTLSAVRDVGETLAYMHARDLIHLDVKPTNIMFNAQGEAVLIDYGITVHESGTETSWPGTAPYAPREQINQDYPDHRADIHALGVTTFEMLTGVLPYRGESANALATSILTSKPFTLAQVDRKLAYLDLLVSKALSPYPEERYDRVQDFVASLHEAHQRHTESKRKVRVVASVIAMAAAVAVFVIVFTTFLAR